MPIKISNLTLLVAILSIVLIVFVTGFNLQGSVENYNPSSIRFENLDTITDSIPASIPASINSNRIEVAGVKRCHKPILKHRDYIRPFYESLSEEEENRKIKRVRWSDMIVKIAN